MFGKTIPRMIEDWFEKAIQFDTNYQEVMAIFGQNRKNDTRTMNKSWYRPAEKKDPNVMDVDTLTFKERQMLIKQGKCIKCRKMGHRVADCPEETDRKGRKKGEPLKDPVKNAFATIWALAKDEREALIRKPSKQKHYWTLEQEENLLTKTLSETRKSRQRTWNILLKFLVWMELQTDKEQLQNTPGWIWWLTDTLNPIIFL